MSVDDILDVIDAGLQSSSEAGEQFDPEMCARCQRGPLADDRGLCAGCRAFLLGDSDRDPVGANSSPIEAMADQMSRDMLLYGSVHTITTSATEPELWPGIEEGATILVGGQHYTVTAVDRSRPGNVIVSVVPYRSPMAGRCLVCGEAEHDGECTRTDMAAPLGYCPAPPEMASERVRRLERELLAQHRRSQRRTNRW